MKSCVNESSGTRAKCVWGRATLAWVLALLVAVSAPIGAQGRSAGSDDLKLDRQLRHRVATSRNEEAPEKVIVRLRPGARRGIIRRLRAQGAVVTADLAVIEAVATRLPRRMLRQL